MNGPISLLFALPLAAALGATIARLGTMKGWRDVWIHRCGRVVDAKVYAGMRCTKCGEHDGNWTTGVARDRFPYGYEWRKPE